MSEEIEVVDSELEAQGDSSLIAVKQDGVSDIFWLAENIDKLVDAQKKIFNGILRITIPGDFVAFGKGEKETVELRGAACERIARDVGVSFVNWTEKREDLTDEKGAYFRYLYECDAIFRSRSLRAMGVVSSRSKFFGREAGSFKEVWEVNRDDVQKAARREAIKEGVKSLLGLRHLNRAELEKSGVRVHSAGGYDFKSKEEKVEGTQTVAVKIKEIRVQKKEAAGDAKGWVKYSIYDEGGTIYTTFSESIAKAADAAKKADQGVSITFHTTKFGHEADSVIAF